jgi:hypothetical protein
MQAGCSDPHVKHVGIERIAYEIGSAPRHGIRLGHQRLEPLHGPEPETPESLGIEWRRRLAFMGGEGRRHFRDALAIRRYRRSNSVAFHPVAPTFGAARGDDVWISCRITQHNRRETEETDTAMNARDKNSKATSGTTPLRPRDVSSRSEVDAFLGQAKKTPQNEIDAFIGKVRQMAPSVGAGKRGRLIFAMDATASREPSWDRACHLQGEMFQETANLGGLDIQLAYYRGFGEFRATGWLSDSAKLLSEMTRVHCMGGQTQIERLLKHAVAETRKEQTQALIFVGDAFEEDIDKVCHAAGELGMLGVPVFCFHEGGDPIARRGLEQIARLTKGAYCPFDASSARQLRELLAAVAVYAAGGRRALENHAQRRGGEALRLTHQMRK